MKLKSARITNYKNIIDSTEFTLDAVTCLVGKNQSGKSAILQALFRINPSDNDIYALNVDRDYPKAYVTEYLADKAHGQSDPTSERVVVARLSLDDDDFELLDEMANVLRLPKPMRDVVVYINYDSGLAFDPIEINEHQFIKDLIESIELYEDTRNTIKNARTFDELTGIVSELESNDTDPEIANDYATLRSAMEQSPHLAVLKQNWYLALKERLPKFIYFDRHAYLDAEIDLAQLMERRDADLLTESDLPLMGLLSLGGLELDEIVDLSQPEDLRTSRSEAASMKIDHQMAPYWRAGPDFQVDLKIEMDAMGSGRPMLLIRIKDVDETGSARFTTRITQRSNGFQWLFSFVALLEYVKTLEPNAVFLLDEPGGSLHGTAQAELLKLIRSQANDKHQFVYTTHSPFMVDPDHLGEVLVLESDGSRGGATVTADFALITRDSLLPLQSAMGYNLLSPLLIGPNILFVEGASDKLYIEKMTAVLADNDQVGLDDRWTVVPVGGISKIAAVTTFFETREQLNVVALCDGTGKHQPDVDDHERHGDASKPRVLFVGDYVGKEFADIEDMFNPSTYLRIVNRTYGIELQVQNLPKGPDRIIERLLKATSGLKPDPKTAEFHFKCAETFARDESNVFARLKDTELDRWESLFTAINHQIDEGG